MSVSHTHTHTASSASAASLSPSLSPSAVDSLIEEERLRQGDRERLLFDVRVGFSLPFDPDALLFNLHFSVDGLDWKEVVDYHTLEELYHKTEALPPLLGSDNSNNNNNNNNSINNNNNSNNHSNNHKNAHNNTQNNTQGTTAPLELPRFLVIDHDGIARFHRLLSLSREYSPPTIKLLDNHCKSLETWLVAVLSHLARLPEPARVTCQALFFRSAEKLAKYEVLLDMFNRERDGENNSAEKSGKKYKAQSVLKSMQRLFGNGNSNNNNNNNNRNSSSTVRESEIVHERAAVVRERDLERDSSVGSQSTTRSPNAAASKSDGHRRSVAWKLNPFKSREKEKSEHDDDNDDDNIFAHDEEGSVRPSSLSFSHSRSPTPQSLPAQSKSSGKNASEKVKSALDVAAKSVLLRVEVQRGEETAQGVVVYEISIRVVGKKYKNPMVYTVSQRFSLFKKLWAQLHEIDAELKTHTKPPSPYADFVHLITAPFPSLPMKCYLGLSLNDSELSQRTRLLDAWFRDVCYFYRNMPNNARQLVRDFLKLDLTQQRDIFFQDQLAWGTIENDKNAHKPILIVNQAVLDAAPDELLEEIETLTAVGDNTASVRGSLAQRQSILQSFSQRQERMECATVRGDADVAGGGGVIRERGGENSQQLNNLLWETASVGGVSKIPKNRAQTSRNIIKYTQ